ncbi:uncharacterized protein SCODWIG_01676 [Saccharomycodes ludwigii]|uniref:JmjC domain-containing protein n=1 Tax=Saccharomycodes ludwigii TaxID=36035 RepID=A0A376B5F2_9ASCO|nr:hypothetical protein SCDLUD_003436 [Saccharomycodes ludwigii]KAH3900454.1 hypothetical protein SCDLUD_003436 [Saccharomycodes ludwigii]SSD59915.1 uncharacterized protein SCODWIG_01676 [Saccharomycodes ludwigii]
MTVVREEQQRFQNATRPHNNNTTKKPKTIPSYRVNVFSTTSFPHPLGIKPSGNLLFSTGATDGVDQLKNRQELLKKNLGKLYNFPEELLIYFISNYINDPKTLLSLSHTSRILYAYTYDDELWRRLYVSEYIKLEATAPEKESINPYGITEWKGSWRKTLLKAPGGEEDEALIQCNGLVFSDLLYRPFQCSQVDFAKIFGKIIKFEMKQSELMTNLNPDFGISRFDEETFTSSLFFSKYINKPFILKSKTPGRWPLNTTIDSLSAKYPNVRFRQEAVNWDLSFYSKYFHNNKDESPLYLFDCNSVAMDTIRKTYTPPKIFQSDFLKLFNQQSHNCRPDHRWLIVGPAGSGSTFHKDPNNTAAWNTVLTGQKLWVMLPPHIKPPGVSTDIDENEVTSPIGICEWVLAGYYNDSVTLAMSNTNPGGTSNNPTINCLIGVTFPGECIYVPAGWWHTVINLTDSVALTENFLPEPIVPQTLNFFKNKQKQISGFHAKDFIKSLQGFLDVHGCDSEAKDTQNIIKLKNFLKENKDRLDTNEDCGVVSELQELGIPLYEFFVELIRNDPTYCKFLPQALKELNNIEIQEYNLKHGGVRNCRESKLWSELTSNGTDRSAKENSTDDKRAFSSGFSFNFKEEYED